MSKEMVISANPHETRVAIMEEGQLCEYYVEREKEFALVGSIYKGRVTRVLPGMQSAFVEIGLDSDAFLYVSDFLEEIEELDHIVTTVEDKVQKMEDQGGQVFSANVAAAVEPPASEPSPASSVIEGAAPVPEDSGQMEAPSAPPLAQQANTTPSNDRGRFENRPHGNRDFRGRDGRRGGRRGGRRSGGSRGGGPRYGRELPSSKYASPRSSDVPSSEPSAPNGYVPIILPGESLAKYKDKVPTATPPAPVEELSTAQPTATLQEPVEQAAAAPSEFNAWSTGGLEPLPGETLSKWLKYQPELDERTESVAPPDVHEEDEEHDEHVEHEEVALQEETVTEAPSEEHVGVDLSEDEAATLAAHVIEAQIEQAEREEHESELAAAELTPPESEASDAHETLDEAEEIGLHEDHVSTDAEADLEEAEGQTEAEAEEEADSESAQEAGVEAIAAENGPAISEENQQPQTELPSAARVQNDFRARMQHPSRRGRDRGRRDNRGRRPQHGFGGSHGHHRPQPRRPQLIADMLKQGQEIIVQIAKEPLGKKGARITSHIALPGRYLVYMPTLDHTGVSRKISSAEDRARLRHLVTEAKGTAGGGFIVRTAAASATPEEIRTDVEFLTRSWTEIKSRSEQRKAPCLLHRDLNLVERILRDYITPDFTAVWVDSEEEYTKVVDFMSRFQPQLVSRVKLYMKDTPVFEEFGIQQEIDKGLRPKVWLKSGGYIVINHTEALVAIDVNTGKYVGKGSNRLEDTIVRTNLEAVKEIVRQMRLRDLGGIIVIDFIDMEERRNREKVMAALEDALRADRAPSKVLRFNEFGLVAITRKRTKQALERTLCQPCPYCVGSGMVKSISTLCYEIQTEARKMAPEIESGSITLRVHPEISKSLKTREASLIEELEHWTKKSVIIQADPTLHWEQYDIY
jgi:ribonuclease G